MTNIQFIAKVTTTVINIQNTVQLQGRLYYSFIARYRKDKTGNLDEVVIEQVAKLQKSMILKEKSRLLNRFKNKMH
jgi:uncharacterized protein